MAIIELGNLHDLSEAELFFCAGPTAGATACPQGGWYPTNALPYVKSKGIGLEECFPYSDQQIPCNTCQDRDKKAVSAAESVEVMDMEDRKEYLRTFGPMIGGFWVYSDFPFYESGVYSHVKGGREGGHCIEVIGYDDDQKCWICKNKTRSSIRCRSLKTLSLE